MNSIVHKAIRQQRPLVVLEFLCDHCGKRIQMAMVAAVGTQKRIAKTYHEDCWRDHIAPAIKLSQEN